MISQKKFEEADGLVLASPVYYASANGSLISLLDRLFHSSKFNKTMKVGASIAVARRGGITATHDELNKYFPNKSDKTCQPTSYAQYQGASPAPGNGNCLWYLRSPGSDQSKVSYIDGVGSICGGPENNLDGGSVNNKLGIRPAMWIEVE